MLRWEDKKEIIADFLKRHNFSVSSIDEMANDLLGQLELAEDLSEPLKSCDFCYADEVSEIMDNEKGVLLKIEKIILDGQEYMACPECKKEQMEKQI